MTEIVKLNCSNFLRRYLKLKDGMNKDHYLSYENILGCVRHFRVIKTQKKQKGGQKHIIDYYDPLVTLNGSNFLGKYLKVKIWYEK